MDTNEEQFKLYKQTETSPQIFGDVTAIVSVVRDGARYHGEVFVMVERPERKLMTTTFAVHSSTVPPVNVDMEFAISIGRDNARARIADLLNAAFDNGKNWQVFLTPFVFEDVVVSHLAKLWMSDRWRKQLYEIEETTNSPALKALLKQLRGLQFISLTSK